MNNIFKQNTLNAIVCQLTTDLLNSENLKVALVQLCHDLQVCNFTMLADPKFGEQYIYRKYFKCNSYQVTTGLLNSENLRIAITQL